MYTRGCRYYILILSNDEAKNAPKYVVAVQKFSSRGIMAKIPGIPIIYVSKFNQILLEPPSEASTKAAEGVT
jgi:hypothetical protein